ncbi:MAG: 50S ribosomal protein L24 [Candidatus Aminicenantes bacterium]|nr:50S ribosomal protein L24 [Candidatus Aminicenantes bacterium]
MALKKGDIVIVTKGKDKGKTGKILIIYPESNRIIVEKVNFVKEFIRPDRSRNIQGGIMEKEAPLSAANVMIYCTDCGQGVRIRKKTLEDGSRIRICQKCEMSLEKQK